MKTIYIITRLSRISFIDDLVKNVNEFKEQCKKLNICVVWAVGIDINKLTPKENKLARNVLFPHANVYNCSTTSELYGSNIANAVLHYIDSFQNIPNTSEIYCYLLDDDNAIHPDMYKYLDVAFDEDPIPELVIFGQIRKDKGYVIITPDINQDNCLGWIDSAQFLIRRDVLRKIGDYGDGYCIDGLTIQKYFEDPELTHNKLVIEETGAYYNYFTELR